MKRDKIVLITASCLGLFMAAQWAYSLSYTRWQYNPYTKKMDAVYYTTSSIPGPKGDTGAQGPQGPAGTGLTTCTPGNGDCGLTINKNTITPTGASTGATTSSTGWIGPGPLGPIFSCYSGNCQPVTYAPASPTVGFVPKWASSPFGALLGDAFKVGTTFTDTYWCRYTTASGLACDQSSPTRTIVTGSATFNPTSVSSGACSAAVDGGTATGVLTTDVIDWAFSGDPSGVTGYDPSGDLGYIIAYPTADHVNFKFCNKSGNAIDPGSLTLNWSVRR